MEAGVEHSQLGMRMTIVGRHINPVPCTETYHVAWMFVKGLDSSVPVPRGPVRYVKEGVWS